MAKKFSNGDFSLYENIPFHDTFGSIRRKEFTCFLLEIFLRLPLGTIKKEDIKVWKEKILEKFSFDDMEYRGDVVVTYQENIYNLEAFSVLNNTGLSKTICYGGRMISSQFERGDCIKNISKVIQIVIVNEVKIEISKKMITKNVFRDERKVLSDLQEIQLIRLDRIKEITYNDGESDKRLFDLLRFLKAKNQKERDLIAMEGEEMLKEINNFIKRFMKNKEAQKKYQKYNFQEKIWQEEGINLGREEGINLGREEGLNIGRMEFAKYLKNTGKNLEEISDTMNIPVDEVKRLLSV